jgi:hypothetical protein
MEACSIFSLATDGAEPPKVWPGDGTGFDQSFARRFDSIFEDDGKLLVTVRAPNRRRIEILGASDDERADPFRFT